MTGIALLGTAIPFPEAQAYPSAPQPTPPVDAAAGPYIFQDDFDGPLGAPPDTPSGRFSTGTKTSRRRFWVIGATTAEMCSSTATPIWSSAPPKKGPTTTAAKFKATGRGIGHTWEARMQFNCLTPGCWPAFWMVNEEPLPDGEVDVVEWYGNRRWAPGSTVHARSDGKTWAGRDIPELVDGAWHTWRCRWEESGFSFWRDYVQGAKPYLTVPAKPIKGVWPFNQPDYLMSMLFSLAVGGPGGGDQSMGSFPADMLIDWIRVW
jgi:hypothetical protein